MKQITAFIGSLGGGGAQGVFVTVVNYYVELGYEVNAVIGTLTNDIYSGALHDQIKIIELGAKSSKKSLTKIVHYIKENDIELAFAFSPELAVNIAIARKISNKNFLIIGRCINTLSYEYSQADGVFRKYITNTLVKKLYNRVDCVIAQADRMREDLIQNFGFQQSQVLTINNPLADKFCDEIGKAPFTERDNYILYVGRFEKQKGLGMLIDAFCKAKASINTEIRLVLIGKGSLEKELRKKVKAQEIQDCVEILPFKKNIEDYYTRASITVLSSHFEGFPNVLSESIACGTPVVAYDLPSGPSDIVIEGENGYLAKYLNVEDLAEKIILALNTSWDYAAVKETANRFRKENILPMYKSAIEKLGM